MAAHLSIVLVEDNDDLRELTADALRGEGHHVVALSCAEELEDHAAVAAANVFLIDLNLPGEDGYSLSRRIRQVQPLVGIIIISARSELQDKIVGYDSGADWYLPKPVPFGELSAALKSFARRHQAQQVESVTPAGGLRLQQRALHGPAGSVRLTPAEETLLIAFARAPSGRLESWQLLELQGMDSAEASKTSLEVRITRMRKKLAQAGAQGHCLESIRGIGYQLLTPVQVIA
jgi:DNA-binding response OmpR family regulator